MHIILFSKTGLTGPYVKLSIFIDSIPYEHIPKVIDL